ncbi:unnamed protein product [Albugo candida]|uniref:Uncharacterized protein n=1 Tax=Albugo candida TaxID=65357 RepID=A0A024FUU5_9STRA|nr:unnamed protein product [Albugo candida]|eukprot:CCI10895.1 unnamed protein product [Albugo candida]
MSLNDHSLSYLSVLELWKPFTRCQNVAPSARRLTLAIILDTWRRSANLRVVRLGMTYAFAHKSTKNPMKIAQIALLLHEFGGIARCSDLAWCCYSMRFRGRHAVSLNDDPGLYFSSRFLESRKCVHRNCIAFSLC